MLTLLMFMSFVTQVMWLILITRKMKENAELMRRYPNDRKLKNMRTFLVGLFFWGLFLGCWYTVYLARHAP